jgi:hypothetical protein
MVTVLARNNQTAVEVTEVLPTGDVKAAVKSLINKGEKYQRYYDLYDGDHPVIFLTAALRDLFNRIDLHVSENWMAVVVDSMLERIDLMRIDVAEAPADIRSMVSDLYDHLELGVESDEMHEAFLVCGEAFVIAGQEPASLAEAMQFDGSFLTLADEVPEVDVQNLEAIFNDPRQVHVEYDRRNPKVMSWGAKWWINDKGLRELVMYYPDRFEYWVSTKKYDKVESGDDFIMDNEEPMRPNPYGRIPIFHFRTRKRRPKSEIENVIDPQLLITKFLNDLLAAAEFAGMVKRYVVTQAQLDENSLEGGPAVWEFPGGDGQGEGTKVGQLEATDLSNYLKAIERETSVISAVSRTPLHYFTQSAGSNLSGEALIALESPLNHKCNKRISRLVPVWKDLIVFLLSLLGYEITRDQVLVVYGKPITIQPLTQAKVRKTNKEAGVPITYQFQYEEGRSKEEIEALKKAVLDQQQQEAFGLGEALLNMSAGKNTPETNINDEADEGEEEEAEAED